jgi:hypothetical protein
MANYILEYILLLLAVILVFGGVEVYRNGDAKIVWKPIFIRYGLVAIAGGVLIAWSNERVFMHIQYVLSLVALALVAQRIKRK